MNDVAMKRTKQTWSDMKFRCFNPRSQQYKNYGARRISVCERWALSFQAFLDDMGLKPEGLTLERMDNEGNYEPGNCRWASRAEQRVNQRTVRLLTFNGVTKPLRHWAKEFDMSEQTLFTRITRRGMSVERALTEPLVTCKMRNSNPKKHAALSQKAGEQQ
jgi:hypothetical protein